MKVMLINPWGINNDEHYTTGFINGIKDKVDLTVISNSWFTRNVPDNVKVKRLFFAKSQNLEQGAFRTFLRGLEYIKAYFQILNYVKKHNFDIIHIHWLLLYKADTLFLKKLRKYTKKIVLTAHNVFPHINGESFIDDLKKVYAQADTIVVHGEAIKTEFLKYFPECKDKIAIQFHGIYFQQNTAVDESKIEDSLKERIKKAQSVYTMIGAQFYNKGTDRLVRAWLNRVSDRPEDLLIIAGKKNGTYRELDELKTDIKNANNIVHLDYFVDDNTANYIMNESICIILPYRHASMSGVVFTAAEFQKTVLCTKTGVLDEYLEDGIDSILCENNDEELSDSIYKLTHTYSNEQLEQMGKKLKNNIHRKYSWETITNNLVKEVYEK